MNEKEKEIYWKGFEDGKRSSLKHNIVLLNAQLNPLGVFLGVKNKKAKKRRTKK